MQLSKPKWLVWPLALILTALASVSKHVGIPVIGGLVHKYDFWFMTAAYGLLFLGTLFKGL